MKRRSLLWMGVLLAALATAACRDTTQLPNPFTDGGLIPVVGEDAGNVGDPCPCRNGLVELPTSGGGCVCRRGCLPGAPVPRCVGWEVCAQLVQQLPNTDGGVKRLDAGACLPAQAPGQTCSPQPCAETLACARLSNEDGGNLCRYTCNPREDAGPIEDASAEDRSSHDAAPAPGHCPEGQRCRTLNGDAGACFPH